MHDAGPNSEELAKEFASKMPKRDLFCFLGSGNDQKRTG